MKTIKVLRTWQNMTQSELAQQAGVDVSHISNIEKGVKRPSLDVLESIATVLHLEAWEILKMEARGIRIIADETIKLETSHDLSGHGQNNV